MFITASSFTFAYDIFNSLFTTFLISDKMIIYLLIGVPRVVINCFADNVNLMRNLEHLKVIPNAIKFL